MLLLTIKNHASERAHCSGDLQGNTPGICRRWMAVEARHKEKRNRRRRQGGKKRERQRKRKVKKKKGLAKMAIVDLPGEMISYIMTFLDNEAFCSARLSHQSFCVDPIDHVLTRRAVPMWLSVPPRDLCVKGRADAVRFLCEHHYALYAHPFTADDIVAAASAGRADIIGVLLENTRSAMWWRFHPRAVEEAVAAGHFDVVEVFRAFGLVTARRATRGACHRTRAQDADATTRQGAAKCRRRAVGPQRVRACRKKRHQRRTSGQSRALLK